MKNIIVLGAGMVAKPLVRYLLDQPEFNVLMLTRTISKAKKIISGHPRGSFEKLDVTTDFERIDYFLQNTDAVISLLPPPYHVKVAERCIKYKVHLITTSYVSDAMQSLDKKAKSSDVLLLNELGLDPGIDHMSAMQIIHEVHGKGGKIKGFNSYCGGLPAKEANTNPWNYKFSWSPRGVVVATKNKAKYLKDAQEIEIPANELFDNYGIITIEGLGDFEVYPNRNSISYIEKYKIPETETMIRWTLRYPGWCETWKMVGKLGLLGEERRNFENLTYRSLISQLINVPQDKEIKKETAKYLGIKDDSEVMKKFEWLGLFNDEPLGLKEGAVIDVFANRLGEKMQYEEGERDMIILHHRFVAEYPDKKEEIIATLVDFGIPHGDSAMSRTVGLPAAIGTKLILEGKIGLRGVYIPVEPEIYKPILKELESQGIIFQETRKSA